MTYGPDVPAPGSAGRYAADEIILYGIRLNEGRSYGELELTERAGWQSPTQLFSLRLELFRQDLAGGGPKLPKAVPQTQVAITVIYGYAYEGGCYRVDKPRIIAFHYDGPDVAAVGCGFDEMGGLGPDSYRMWAITTKTPMLELTASIGSAETLLLEANLPGKRSPNTYGSKMQLAHRGGRLTTT